MIFQDDCTPSRLQEFYILLPLLDSQARLYLQLLLSVQPSSKRSTVRVGYDGLLISKYWGNAANFSRLVASKLNVPCHISD